MVIKYLSQSRMQSSHHFDHTFSPLTSQWPGDQHYPPQQQWSANSFDDAHFGGLPSISLDSGYAGDSHLPRLVPQDAQHALTPPWPSILSSQQPYSQSTYTRIPLLSGGSGLRLTEPLPSLVSPSSTELLSSPAAPAPRRILTDADRRRMCIYNRDYPEKKQTEIGERFGVERSTVSKVLRQKEKYLSLPAEHLSSRPPLPHRTRHRSPDIERALAKWAQNIETTKGATPTDAMLTQQANFFSLSTTNNASAAGPAFDDAWLEAFKRNRSRYGSIDQSSRAAKVRRASAVTTTSVASSAASASPATSTQRSASLSSVDANVAACPTSFEYPSYATRTQQAQPQPQGGNQAPNYILGPSHTQHATSTPNALFSGLLPSPSPYVPISSYPFPTAGPAVVEGSLGGTSTGAVSDAEAKRALVCLMRYLQLQPPGSVEAGEAAVMGRLMARLGARVDGGCGEENGDA